MYSKYAIFFYEDDVYKMVQHTSSEMYDMLAKVVIMRKCARITKGDIEHIRMEDEFIEKNEVVFKGKHYKYAKYIRKASVRYVSEAELP